MQLDTTERHIMGKKGSRHTLMIRKVHPQDFGNYSVIYWNVFLVFTVLYFVRPLWEWKRFHFCCLLLPFGHFSVLQRIRLERLAKLCNWPENRTRPSFGRHQPANIKTGKDITHYFHIRTLAHTNKHIYMHTHLKHSNLPISSSANKICEI